MTYEQCVHMVNVYILDCLVVGLVLINIILLYNNALSLMVQMGDGGGIKVDLRSAGSHWFFVPWAQQ